MSSSDDEYEVQEIRGARFEKEHMEYKVHWKNYSTDDDTWEPDYMVDCPILITKFFEGENEKSRYTVNNVFQSKNELFISATNDNNEQITLTRKMAHKICPEALLLFYESRLEFPAERSKNTFFFSQK